MASDVISIRLDLDDSRFSGDMKISTEAVKKLGDAFTQTGRKADHSSGQVTKAHQKFRMFAIDMALLEGVLRRVGTALSYPLVKIVQVNAEMEKMTVLLEGLSKSGGEFSAAQGAERDLRELIERARETPYALKELTDSFVKLKAAGLDPLDGSFDALVDSAAKFGKTGEELKRASIAIQQMAGKGVISMEELRQQLGEAVPDAMQSMAAGLGLGMSELTKIISTGSLEAQGALDAMLTEMELRNKGSAARLMDTWNGAIDRMISNLQLLALSFGKTGFFDELKNQLQVVSDTILASTEMHEVMTDLGLSFTDALKAVSGLTDAFKAFAGELSNVIKYLAILAGASMLKVTTWAIFSRGVMAANAALAAFLGKMTAVGVSAAIASTNLGTLTGAFAAFRTMILASTAGLSGLLKVFAVIGTTIKVGISFLLRFAGVWGVLAAAIYGAAKALGVFEKTSERVGEILDQNIESGLGISTKLANEVEAIVSAKQEAIDKIQKRLDDGGRSLVGGRAIKLDTPERVKELEAELARLQDEVYGLSGKTLTALGQNIENAGNKIAKDTLRSIEDSLKDVRKAYQESYKEIDDLLKSQDLTDDEARERRLELGQTEANALLDKQYKLLQSEKMALSEAIEKLESMGSKEARKKSEEFRVALRVLNEEQLQIDKIRQSFESTRKFQASLKDKFGGGAGSDKTLTFYKQLSVRLAAAKAKMADLGIETAKVKAKFEAGLLDPNHKDASAIRQMAMELDEVKNTQEAASAAAKVFERAQRKAVDIQSIAAQQLEKNNNRNPFLQAQQGAAMLTIQTEGLIKKLQEVREAQTIEKQNESDNLIANMREDLESIEKSAAMDGINQMTDAVKEYQMTWMTAEEAVRFSTEEQMKWVVEMTKVVGGAIDENMAAKIYNYIEMLEQLQKDNTSALRRLARDWSTITYGIEEVAVDMFEGMTDAMTDFIVTGKADFQSFLEDIQKMIVKSAIQKMMSQMLIGIGFGGGGGGGADVGTSSAFTSYFAKGGVMTDEGEVPLRKYAMGGIANTPQLAMFGEGSQPEAYVPLPDGRSIPVAMKGKDGGPNVSVNMINETGQDVTAEQEGAMFDGEQFVIDVVMKRATQPGPMRDVMRSIK